MNVFHSIDACMRNGPFYDANVDLMRIDPDSKIFIQFLYSNHTEATFAPNLFPNRFLFAHFSFPFS